MLSRMVTQLMTSRDCMMSQWWQCNMQHDTNTLY